MKRILIIEDEFYIRAVMDEILEDNGFEVVTASCFYEGFSKVKIQHVDLVILDFYLPDLNADEGVKLIREKFPDKKIIICTGQLTKQTFSSLAEYNISDFIVKPIKPFDLVRRVKKVIESET